MAFLNKLTGGGVDWQLQLASTAVAYRPGDVLRGTVTFTPRSTIEARAAVVSLIATEHYRYVERRRRGGDVDTDQETGSHELLRQAVQLDGPTSFAGGTPVTRQFELAIPQGAPPTFDQRALRCTWKLEAKLDVGGVDPSTEIVIVVVQSAAALAAVGGAAATPRVDGTEDGQPYGIWLEPVPMFLGGAFRGGIDLREPLGGDARVELKVHVQSGRGSTLGEAIVADILDTSSYGSVSETSTIWRGDVREAGTAEGWHRYGFEGTLPAEMVPTVTLPHGRARARIEVIVPRRLRSDVRYAREVALANAP